MTDTTNLPATTRIDFVDRVYISPMQNQSWYIEMSESNDAYKWTKNIEQASCFFQDEAEKIKDRLELAGSGPLIIVKASEEIQRRTS